MTLTPEREQVIREQYRSHHYPAVGELLAEIDRLRQLGNTLARRLDYRYPYPGNEQDAIAAWREAQP